MRLPKKNIKRSVIVKNENLILCFVFFFSIFGSLPNASKMTNMLSINYGDVFQNNLAYLFW